MTIFQRFDFFAFFNPLTFFKDFSLQKNILTGENFNFNFFYFKNFFKHFFPLTSLDGFTMVWSWKYKNLRII